MRRWSSVDEFVGEVAVARVYEGVHFRNSTEIGAQMGRQIGALAASKLLKPQQPTPLLACILPQTKRGLSFSCVGMTSTFFAPGWIVRTTTPEPLPSGCIPNS